MHYTQSIKGSQAPQLTPTGNKGPEDFEETGQSCSKAPNPHDEVSGTVAPLCMFEPSFCCLQAVWPQETDFPSLGSSIVTCKLGMVYSICLHLCFCESYALGVLPETLFLSFSFHGDLSCDPGSLIRCIHVKPEMQVPHGACDGEARAGTSTNI